jgi:EAL and modified HD-GYP domain-containing signal transduction protein
MSDFFVGRQPIYDRDLDVIGYELLYRSDPSVNYANFDDVDQAVSQVLLDTLVEVGLENIVGDNLAFVNFTRPFLVGDYNIPFSHKQVVVEVLEDVEVDAQLLEAVSRMRDQGLTIALDDFIYRSDLKPLMELVQIIKVDILQLTDHQLAEYATLLKHQGVKMLAEKVETHEAYERCRELGFDYFQGYFFCKPRIVQGRYIPSNRLALLELLAKLNSSDAEFADLAETIRRDVSLSYKVLRLINSAYYSLPRKINSVEESIVLLGINNLSNLIALINLARIDDKPSELTVTAMIRARMCENLARELGRSEYQSYFTAGLFSALDALLDSGMDEIIRLLPLTDELNEALLSRTGPIGEILSVTLAYERAEWDGVFLEGVEPERVREVYFEAIAWADGLHRQILEPDE